MTGTVRRTSLLFDCSRPSAPVMVVVFVNWCASTSTALTLQVDVGEHLGGSAAMKELARQIRSYVDSYNEPDNVSWSE